MIAVVTVLLAFPLGWSIRSWTAANLAYAVAYLWAFVFQGVYLMLEVVGGQREGTAFRPQEFPASYGLVTAAIFGAGFGLVALGHRVRARRRSTAGAVPAPAR